MTLLVLTAATGVGTSGDATIPASAGSLTLTQTAPAISGQAALTVSAVAGNSTLSVPVAVVSHADAPVATAGVLSLVVPSPTVTSTPFEVVATPAVLRLSSTGGQVHAATLPVQSDESWSGVGVLVANGTGTAPYGALVVTTNMTGAAWNGGFLRDEAGRLVVIFD